MQQQLELDLMVGDDGVLHFDSGLVPGGGQFPHINVPVSLHGQRCFDIVFVVDASPVPAKQIHPYALLPESTFQRGCFPPCLCALGTQERIIGTFTLVDLGQGPLFAEFAVHSVDWRAGLFPEAASWNDVPVRGFGIYRVGGEFAVQQQLGLDLGVGSEPPVHFDSGLVDGGGEFPRIDIVISVHGGVCFDTVIDLHALPIDGGTGGSPSGAGASSASSAGDGRRLTRGAKVRRDAVTVTWTPPSLILSPRAVDCPIVPAQWARGSGRPIAPSAAGQSSSH